ncbi:hypothetical protein F991_01079 [Acinetobacter sp. CIP-A165]|nr:hypothetical protein F991_01079 [Acinetobacter sp. CIP-A165]
MNKTKDIAKLCNDIQEIVESYRLSESPALLFINE